MAATPATSSATRRRAPSRRNSAPSRPRSRPGSGASSPVRRCSAMANALGRQDTKLAISNLANWTDRIAGGELPFAKPRAAARRRAQRRHHPVGLGRPQAYLHDQVSTDKRNPTVNAYGKHLRRDGGKPRILPGVRSAAQLSRPRSRCRCAKPTWSRPKSATMAPSPYWGDEAIWDSHSTTHSLMMDETGDVWFTSRGRQRRQSGLLQGRDRTIRRRKAFPLNQSNRHLAMYDPEDRAAPS